MGSKAKKGLRQRLTEKLIWLDSKYGHPPWHHRLIEEVFSSALCAGSFAFWSEPERGLAEVRRVLKPGGRLYIIDVYEEGPFWAAGFEKIFGRLPSYKTNVYSSQEFREFLQRAGFTVVYQKEVMGTLVTMGIKKPGDESPGRAMSRQNAHLIGISSGSVLT